MTRRLIFGFLALAAFAALAPIASASGGSDPVIRTGPCSGASDWKLKAKLDDGRIETEFEVDQNRIGRDWRVTLRQNGEVVFRGVRTTQAPSGSFEVRRTVANTAGPDRIVARARALATDEICRGVVTI